MCADQNGYDEVDGPAEDTEDIPMCTYLLMSSYDKLDLNVTPQAMDVITEVIEVSIT